MIEACKNRSEEQKNLTLDIYTKSQKHYRDAIEEEEKKRTNERIKKLINRTKKDPNMIWQARKRARTNNEIEYNMITEDGREITDPQKTKEHIANYFEDLYQARPGTPEYEESTKHITDTMKKLKLEYKRETNGKTITEKEMEYTIKRLKRNKSLGPDKIPNEIFIEANKETKKIYQEIMNTVYKQEIIPERWQEGEIKRLYKGKGQEGKCSNERGITLASNIGKVFERIINERVKKEVYITEAQGGGIPGNATVDHIVALKEAANQILKRGKTAYMIFLDVQKAYGKAWLDAILYALYRNGVGKKNLEIIRKLNTGLTAQIQTKYGLTRKITIRDSIRQGGVLSVIEYATLMDEITKEINKSDMGLELRNGEKLRDLLWMDDVLLIHENAKEVQKMLDVTNHIALKST